MIYINKNNEPDWLIDFKKKNPKALYSSEEFSSYRTKLRESLIHEQKGLCAYCCCKIGIDSSLNEHIEPQNLKSGAKSKKTLDYNNLIASCKKNKGEITCGAAKGNEFDGSKFISPLNPSCEDAFKYLADGTVKGDDYTINLLNLNASWLIEARRAVYKQLQYFDKNEIIEMFCSDSDNLYNFTDVIRYYLKTH